MTLAALAAAEAQGGASAIGASPADMREALAFSEEELIASQKADAATLDAQLTSEGRDSQWATSTERETADAVARLSKSVRLDEVTCRQTLCRARIRHVDPNLDPRKREGDIDQLLSLPVITNQALVAPGDDGTSILYFSRRGSPLSVLQAPPHSLLPPSAAALEESTDP